jgi:hypothetical protein
MPVGDRCDPTWANGYLWPKEDLRNQSKEARPDTPVAALG